MTWFLEKKKMKVYKLFSIEEIRTAWKTGDERIHVEGKFTANLKSQRLELFFKKGLKCVHCGIEGAYFSAEKALYGQDKNPHLNLYSAEGILMTKDHIVSKSKGGKNHLSNYQTMCGPCNWNKGSN